MKKKVDVQDESNGIVSNYPQELLVLIFIYLIPEDLIFNIQLTSRAFSLVVCHDFLWKLKFHRHFPDLLEEFNKMKDQTWYLKFIEAYKQRRENLSFPTRVLFSLEMEDSFKEDTSLLKGLLLTVENIYEINNQGQNIIRLAQTRKSQILLDYLFKRFIEPKMKPPFWSSILALLPERNILHETKRTPIHWYAVFNQSEAIRLGAASSHIDALDENNLTALHIASAAGHREAVQALLEKGAAIDKYYEGMTDFTKKTAPVFASEYGYMERNEEGDFEEYPFLRGTSALLLATLNNHPDIVQLLLDAGARYKDLALYHAAAKGYHKVVQVVLQKTVSINRTYALNQTPLILATIGGHFEVVKLLLAEETIDINMEAFGGKTALIIAAQCGHLNIVNELLQKKDINFNHHCHELNTALSYATIRGHLAVVQRLLVEKRIEVNWQDNIKQTALMIAVYKNDLPMVQAFLTRDDLNVNLQDSAGMTPLMVAAERGYLEIVKALLAIDNIDLNCLSLNKESAFFLALDYSHFAVIQALLEQKNLAINQPCHDITAIFIAAFEGNVDLVKLLLAKGADPMLKVCFDQNRLREIAAEATNFRVAEKFFTKRDEQYSPRMWRKSKVYLTALDIAQLMRHAEVFKILSEYSEEEIVEVKPC